MHNIIVAGIGTEVGKTVVSAILTTLFKGDYWKPIECGDEKHSDTSAMRRLIDTTKHRIYNPQYSLKTPLSPHHAARLENISINIDSITLPEAKHPLIIESIGGIFVPLTTQILSFDLFKSWNGQWIIVSKHYLGSINHTLLTLHALKQYGIRIAGLIFNGEPNVDTEAAVLEISQLPLLGRLLPETNINLNTIQRYAKKWHPRFSTLIL
jgi:dethiobiotin synthetase